MFEAEWSDLLRLVSAVLAGACIGFERELYDKPAGLRTNILICLGAALFTLLSLRFAESAGMGDHTRIAAQIVTGVGFLGAGVIMQARGRVLGLTTAATIWVDASVGMAFGAGQYVIGIVGTLMIVGVLFGLSYVERMIRHWRVSAKFEIELDPSSDGGKAVEKLIRNFGLYCEKWRLIREDDKCLGKLKVTGPPRTIDVFQRALMGDPGVISVTRRWESPAVP
ncbi:MAG: MgtC/SapB family protein [Phycisphaerae bacterium]|nr:MgtC/SapB family protein [Phycisphaerae bacterium]